MSRNHRTLCMSIACFAALAGVYFHGTTFGDAGASANSDHAGVTTTQPSDVVDDQLVRKLLGGQSSARDTVEATLGHMEEAADRLTERLDPGKETQKIQEEILNGLDRLIEEAGKSRSAPDRHRRVRRKTDRPSKGQRRADGQKRSGTSGVAPVPQGPAGEDASKKGRNKGKPTKADLARQWGFLPERDRDEVIQGFDEKFLPKFREQIHDYYRNLAEEAQKSGQVRP
ncbi:MAG: hypothetical protein MI923_01645 [Phycisphaerales bacterium]|nr:hypothetical protein [Phycisphaerales bacterium]